MSLMYIRLELARSKEYPQGSSDFGYEVVAPLTADGHIDPEVWRQHRKACTWCAPAAVIGFSTMMWRGIPMKTTRVFGSPATLSGRVNMSR